MAASKKAQLQKLGFQRFAVLLGNQLRIEQELTSRPAVYMATLKDRVFWVGETRDVKRRFYQYRRWLTQPKDGSRPDARTRDLLLEMIGDCQLVFYLKDPIQVRSNLNMQYYSGHRVEETMLIDYFEPAWNIRPGGRRKG